MTPRENAYMIATDALRHAHVKKVRESVDYVMRGGSSRMLGDDIKEMNAIAKLHNRLLDQSGMDGTHLEIRK